MARRQERPRGLRNIPRSGSCGDGERDFAASTGINVLATQLTSAKSGLRLSCALLLTSLSSAFALQLVLLTRSVSPSHPVQFGCTVTCAVAVFTLHLRNCLPSSEHLLPCQRGAVVLVQAAGTYLPLLASGIVWTGDTSFLAGSVLLIASRWKAWALFAAVTLSVFAATVTDRQGVWQIAATSIGSGALGIAVFGICRLERLARHERATQAEIAQLAVIRERARFAGDLHDLLGYNLSAIALKAELSRRVMAITPDRASKELADVIGLARQAMADVRQVADGYRTMSLAAEARSAASLFAAALIVADIDIDIGVLDSKVDTALATVLREGVTNLLRHSSARTCRIAASRTGESVTLVVANDGAPKSGMAYRDGGGLESLAMRMETVGGALTGESQDGTFVLIASVPHAAPGSHRCRIPVVSPREPTCEEVS